jgi:hypothetical protein
MAIPPIISNLPIFRLFKSDKGGKTGAPVANESVASSSSDTVEISSAAQDKLDLSRAREAVAKIKQYLEQHPITLGLDPAFE